MNRDYLNAQIRQNLNNTVDFITKVYEYYTEGDKVNKHRNTNKNKPLFKSKTTKEIGHIIRNYFIGFRFFSNIEKVYIKPSKIHGNGVFALNNIKKDELITIYPAHYLIVRPNGYNKCKEAGTVHFILKSDIVEDNELNINDDIKIDYTFHINDYYSICGDPRLTDDCNFVGHMINDGIKGHSTEDDINTLDNNIYNNITGLKNNSRFKIIDDYCVAIVSTRDITKDEEILIGYNYAYWVEHNTYELNK